MSASGHGDGPRLVVEEDLVQTRAQSALADEVLVDRGDEVLDRARAGAGHEPRGEDLETLEGALGDLFRNTKPLPCDALQDRRDVLRGDVVGSDLARETEIGEEGDRLPLLNETRKKLLMDTFVRELSLGPTTGLIAKRGATRPIEFVFITRPNDTRHGEPPYALPKVFLGRTDEKVCLFVLNVNNTL